MLAGMSDTSPSPLHVACLCAAWCRTCDGYAPVFEQVLQGLRNQHPNLVTHWIDIEDEAELLGHAVGHVLRLDRRGGGAAAADQGA